MDTTSVITYAMPGPARLDLSISGQRMSGRR